MRGAYVRLFLDLETIPDQREGAADKAASLISAPSNYRDPEKIAAYVAERAAEAWRKTSLDGGYGEVICIGYALDNEPAVVLHRKADSGPDGERELLAAFWSMVDEEVVDTPTWVGHNILRFDLRFLWRRSIVLGVPMYRRIPFDVSPWSDQVQDTMLMWTVDRNAFISQDELLSILGIDSGDPINGADVWDRVQAGDYRAVIDHCARNVEEMREAWQRMALAPGA